ncbi:nucleotidyltransferase family protein [Polaromonas sp. YR568]|uniref:nucleotidyltransferase family protein n=1 Tax=Polaromonas sp. YR568 TaxID=1855301 RepID=UPI00398C232A
MTPFEAPSPDGFIRDALKNRHNQRILAQLPALGLPDAWLVAGCLFQTVWNVRSGQPPEAHIKDYDLFYFDPTDLSEATEAHVNERAQSCFAGHGITVEAKNQARVHTWYEDFFGFPYPALRSSREGIDRFLVRCTCVGLKAGGSDVELYAPNGVDDLYKGRLSPNPLCHHLPLFEKKAKAYQERWTWLQICA